MTPAQKELMYGPPKQGSLPIVIRDHPDAVFFYGPLGSKAELARELTDIAGGVLIEYTLEWIYVPPEARGKGVGDSIMQEIIRFCARHKITLEAIACAQTNGPDQEKLEQWYREWGFTMTRKKGPRGGPIMVRKAGKTP